MSRASRRAARELALILFSQFDKEITKYSRKDLLIINQELKNFQKVFKFS